MKAADLGYLKNKGAEIFLAFVYPTGANLDGVMNAVKNRLAAHGYKSEEIRLTHLLGALREKLGIDDELRDSPEFERIRSHQKAGTNARRRSGRGEILALSAVNAIVEHRKDHFAQLRERAKSRGDNRALLALPTEGVDRPLPAVPQTAYLLRSLKHPHEVELLRSIYGDALF